MNKEFIPYEQALALKELGFDEPCILLYRGLDTQPVCQMDYEFKTEKNSDYNDETNYWLTVPTYSQAFRWFREKHELSCSVELTDNSRHYYFDFTIYDSKNRDWNDEDCFDSCRRIYDDGKFGTYEEAELECLKKLIEIVKNK
jgi:hypothetical protein